VPYPSSDLRRHRRLRFRRRGKRAYIRSVHIIPSLATLGNLVCGLGAIYIVFLSPNPAINDPITQIFATHKYLVASYLILLAMVFDALDGRLARWARHTTDFGGQLDSMADVISFGAAPAMIVLALCREELTVLPLIASRLIWAICAIYVCCAAVRLARFNVSNEHGEQAHMSFLGLPSPGAAAAVIGLVLIEQDLRIEAAAGYPSLDVLAHIITASLPIFVLIFGLLMVSGFRYPHLVNKHLRGRRGFKSVVVAMLLAALLFTAHRYTFGIAAVCYGLSAPVWFGWSKWRIKSVRGPSLK
jgi:CDP-diacylglycerol---serine O-phosphatidyltransferase